MIHQFLSTSVPCFDHLADRTPHRLRATQNRVWQHYGLDLAAAWPRLWLVVDDATRQTVAAARCGFDAATALAAWSALYAALAVVWWPGGVIGAVVIAAGARRGLRAAAHGLRRYKVTVVGADGIDGPGAGLAASADTRHGQRGGGPGEPVRLSIVGDVVVRCGAVRTPSL